MKDFHEAAGIAMLAIQEKKAAQEWHPPSQSQSLTLACKKHLMVRLTELQLQCAPVEQLHTQLAALKEGLIEACIPVQLGLGLGPNRGLHSRS